MVVVNTGNAGWYKLIIHRMVTKPKICESCLGYQNLNKGQMRKLRLFILLLYNRVQKAKIELLLFWLKGRLQHEWTKTLITVPEFTSETLWAMVNRFVHVLFRTTCGKGSWVEHQPSLKILNTKKFKFI